MRFRTVDEYIINAIKPIILPTRESHSGVTLVVTTKIEVHCQSNSGVTLECKELPGTLGALESLQESLDSSSLSRNTPECPGVTPEKEVVM